MNDCSAGTLRAFGTRYEFFKVLRACPTWLLIITLGENEGWGSFESFAAAKEAKFSDKAHIYAVVTWLGFSKNFSCERPFRRKKIFQTSWQVEALNNTHYRETVCGCGLLGIRGKMIGVYNEHPATETSHFMNEIVQAISFRWYEYIKDIMLEQLKYWAHGKVPIKCL